MTSGQPRILQGFWLTLFSILYIWQLLHIQNTYQRTDKVINEDALGYYLILPAYFKYNDPRFAFLDTTLRKTETYKNYFPPVVNTIDNNKNVCKYYSGVALLQAPFYLMAQSTDKENGHGFGLHYQKWILISVVFFVLLGSFLYFQLFTAFGASHFQAFLMLCFIVFGTNLQTYLTYDPAYSHAYTFFAFACLLYLLHRFKIRKRAMTAFGIGLILGLITVIRPLNLYVGIIVPVMIGLPYFLSIRKHIGHVSLLIMGGTVFPLIQTFIWHWQTGQFWVYPYGRETLNLKHAQLTEFLFGFDNGWAIYTPSAFLLLFIGLIIGFHRKTIQITLIGLIGFAGLLYILSSWYYLHYGCTSGCRPITEYYGIMAVLFVYNWNNSPLKHQLKYIILPVLIAAFAYNRVVLYQYYNHIINWCNMDKQRFSMIFMRTHEVYKYSTYPFWDFSQYETKPYSDSVLVNQTLKIDESVNIKTEKKTESDNRVLVQIRGRARSTLKSAYLRILITKEGQYIEQQTVLLQRKMSIDGQWHEFEFKFPVHTRLAGANFWIKLEAAERGKDGTLRVRDITFKGLE